MLLFHMFPLCAAMCTYVVLVQSVFLVEEEAEWIMAVVPTDVQSGAPHYFVAAELPQAV